eukprot:7004083-Pyramimonas_sp.AAC.1
MNDKQPLCVRLCDWQAACSSSATARTARCPRRTRASSRCSSRRCSRPRRSSTRASSSTGGCPTRTDSASP